MRSSSSASFLSRGHRRIVLSSLADAAHLPSGEMATALIPSECPVNDAISLDVSRSQYLTTRSPAALTARLPDAASARHVIGAVCDVGTRVALAALSFHASSALSALAASTRFGPPTRAVA